MAASEPAVAGLNLSIERMTEHDLLDVCRIEQVSDLSAWGWDAYHKELQSIPESIMLVARVDSAFHGTEIVGFIVARLIAGELHINNVAVRPDFRRQGVGARLVMTTLYLATQRGATVAYLEVRARNDAAQVLYQRCGFTFTGRRKNYYRQPVEDALLMTASLKGSS